MKEKEEKFGIGKRFITNEGYEVEIVEKIDKLRRLVRFENGYEIGANVTNIREGRIKNPYHPSVYGIGYYGAGEYKCSVNGKDTPEYKTWNHMLERCYDKKYQEKYPTYIGTKVCSEWYNFQTFAKWYHENKPKIEEENFHLDKDLLQQNVDNKIYSPETCVFLPYNVNLFLANKCSNNKSRYVGVSWYKRYKKWNVNISLFGEGKVKNLGYFYTPEEASKAYQEARSEQSEKVKNHLRSLNYLPEEIINLIK